MMQFARNLLGRLFVAFSSIHIESSHSSRLVLNVNGCRLTVDQSCQTVKSSGQRMAHFGSVEFVEIQQWQNGKGYRWWVVSLHLAKGKCLRVGRTANDAQASIAAAHLGTILNKQVRLTSRWSAI